VSSVLLAELQQLVSAHGYWVVALIVGLESMGLPLPGETILVLAAIYAATEPSFNVGVVIAVAAFGAIVGDNAGYWLGLRYAVTPFCCDTVSGLACLKPASNSGTTCS
jgi:membrane protein DedA with SNARE-associated domain